ncbi:MAG: hypothetical protein Q3977_01830 [Oscillospiraceae bacterium]|nr:hypothetical protein [Oscillospiraceae bacterium]
MKKITALVLALLLTLSLCACGGSGSDSSMLGTYTLYAMNYDETHVVLAKDLFSGKNYVTLKSGGAAEMALEDDVANVTWKADGEKVTVTAADGDMEGTLKDGILTLVADGSNLYFVAEGASTENLHALTLDELLTGVAEGANTEEANAAGGADVAQAWNGWYFGCIDFSACTGRWESFNGSTYDAVMYVELDQSGKGKLAIYDPFGNMISNEDSNVYVQADCHADEQRLYCDSGEAFNTAINPSEWVFVHNLSIPEKLNVGSSSTEASGDKIGYDFQFKPWGDKWEGDDYTQFIPYFTSYIDAIDAGLTSPFDDSFKGFGIAETPASSASESAPAVTEPAAASSALLGANPTKLDINGRGIASVSYPADQFVYDDGYGKLKNETTGVGILIDPMLGATNFEELKASYQEKNSKEDDYSLVETTVCDYKALILKYSDWLGSTMRVDLDFGGEHDGWYGISFAVSGDSLKDCDTELVWAIIQSLELVK